MTRDDAKWTLIMALAVIAGLALLSDKTVTAMGLPAAITPWLPWCRLITFAAAIIGAKMGNSPLRGMTVDEKTQTSGTGTSRIGAVLLACALAGGVATMPACASHAPTKAAAVADNATKVQQSANVILHAAQQGNAIILPNGRPMISEQQLVDVALVVNKVGHLGQDLKRALEDYAAAVKAGTDLGLQRAVATRILLDISTALADVGRAIPSGTFQTIDRAVTDILFVLDLVKGGLGL
jgi:hypothetical protein